MKTIICIVLFCALFADTASSRQLSQRPHSSEISNANARFVSHRHRYRHSYRVRHSNVRDNKTVTWATGVPVRYPYATGTTILDAFEGRKPVIGRSDCDYPGQDWYRGRSFHAWAVPD